ncbi:MAG: hypothetical protein AVDCRST_MAG68-3698 [uncultured Gemmatimonadetes bacterium]|uniref:Uncharacterized protein n=1 Tax=uncultured Gemmatimonadota bacterium TaxID=203437 RepID=A0A6J4M8H9_9BACT|nr:MAG: hypothetical protein AVDCRST_MAG68-3698 [uncultured Gemmatimonadota bacterium]
MGASPGVGNGGYGGGGGTVGRAARGRWGAHAGCASTRTEGAAPWHVRYG